MPRYRSFDVAFKRQVAQEFLIGESSGKFEHDNWLKAVPVANFIRLAVDRESGNAVM